MLNEEIAKKIYNGLGFIAFLLWLIFILMLLQWVTDSETTTQTLGRMGVAILMQLIVIRNLNSVKDWQ